MFIRSSVVIPGVLGKRTARSEDAERLVFKRTELPGEFTHFGHAHRCAVRELIQRRHIAEVARAEVGVARAVPPAESRDLPRARPHAENRAADRMGRIIHRRSEFSAPEIGLLAGGPLAADPAFRSLALNDAQTAGVVHVVHVLALGVDEVAELSGERLAAAEHRLRPEAGGLTEHVMFPRSLRGFDDPVAPVEHLIAVRQTAQRHRAVHRLARLHRLDALRRMQPRLRDDHERVQIAAADFVQGGVHVSRIEFVREKRIFRKLLHPVRFAVAERDPVHERMRFEQRCKRTAEIPESHHADADSHTIPLS